jgi:hypothetical protein
VLLYARATDRKGLLTALTSLDSVPIAAAGWGVVRRTRMAEYGRLGFLAQGQGPCPRSRLGPVRVHRRISGDGDRRCVCGFELQQAQQGAAQPWARAQEMHPRRCVALLCVSAVPVLGVKPVLFAYPAGLVGLAECS